MKFKYYIAGRFFPSEEKEYVTHYSSFFNEIVTTDQYLCKLRYFDSLSNEYVGIMDDYEKIKAFALHKKEQLIKFIEVKEQMIFDSDEEFECCGFDIMYTFEDESILTSMGIPYDKNIYKYTQYGLLDSFEGSKRWVADHSRVNILLENGDYLIFAVWRKINPD